MASYIARRLLWTLLLLLVITAVTFLIFYVIPSADPAAQRAGRDPSPALIDAIRHQLGLDKSLPAQYWNYTKKLFFHFDFGQSFINNTSVKSLIFDRLPNTIFLVIGAAIIWFVTGVGLGLFTAVRAGRWSDRLVTVLALVGISMPVFWLGIVSRYYLAEGGLVTWFPDGEYVGLTDNPLEWLSHLILPWIVLAVLFIGFYGRVLRGNILDTINEDYVRTAKAKGLSQRRIMVKHVLRTSLIPVVTLFGLDFAAVLGGGAILTETVFDLHGVGQYAAQSIDNFDLPPIMGVTMYGAFFIVAFSMLVDLFYAYLDPRIRPT